MAELAFCVKSATAAFSYVPFADETRLERTVSAGIRWMMNLLSESSPYSSTVIWTKDLAFVWKGAIVTVGSWRSCDFCSYLSCVAVPVCHAISSRLIATSCAMPGTSVRLHLRVC